MSGACNICHTKPNWLHLLLAEQPHVLRSKGVYRRIQRIKQVRNTVERSSDCSGGGGSGRGENSHDEKKLVMSLMITPQPKVLRSNGVDRRIQRANRSGRGLKEVLIVAVGGSGSDHAAKRPVARVLCPK